MKQMIKTATQHTIKTIVNGFLLGIGISISFYIITHAYQRFLFSHESSMERFGYEKYTAESGLRVTKHSDRKTDNRVTILAEIENSGDSEWTSVTVEAELFDENDEFIAECSDYIEGTLRPGDKENISIECGGCEGSNVLTYARYTVSVKDASSF